MTHYDYLEHYLLTHVSYSKQTIKAYRSDLRQMKTNRVEWSVKSLQLYFDQLIQQYKPATAMRRYHALMALGHELVRAKRLKNNPMRQVRPIVHQYVHQREYYPLEEAIQTIRQINHSTYRLFFELISQTGLRFMEARLLSIEDIQFGTLTLLVRHGKGRRLRTVPLGEGLVSKLQTFLAGRTTGLIFQSVRGKAINEQSARDTLRKQSLATCGRPLHPHDLRVAFATHLYQVEDCKLVEIQRLLGHGSTRTTEGYILSRETRLQQILNTLSASAG
ncbi:integrase family protein [Exiguobacterium sibiricum 255-15]|uniref:Integrase family protein n=1 Tax=Exiguobacterium sibiricum (strain DSM 17290 / CCUG 55495 / CIP 109462 / JCM 13490 / 255-15) TaxID=262543 RepID=B1YML0_EXIS2|nr:tyrosine-type recombinase/integrase [Exiguobacterium sibiricum]ACB62070.1 integrase family protein [Exiguobacterium sibiricum 255-15]